MGSNGDQLGQTQESQSFTVRVLEAIAGLESMDPLDFDEPLYSVIDPDALDALFRSRRSAGFVSFEYLGYQVTVRSDGDVDVA